MSEQVRSGAASAPTPQELWRLAQAEAEAAAVLVADPMVGDVEVASRHSLDAWRFLIGSQCGGTMPEDSDLGAWLRAGRLRQIGEKHREAVAEWVARIATEPARVKVRRFRAHLRELEQVVADVGADVAGWSSRREHQIRWIWRGVFAVVVLAILVAWGLLWRDALAPGRWRGTYYPARDFAGLPIVRRDRDIDFDWGDGRPMDEIREDAFSVRWDSCLVVAAPITAAFQLVSNNGSRLFVDGDLAVDNWDNNFTRTRGGEVDLAVGVHHLRVEYWEGARSANVTLLASLDGDPPRAIPRSRLRYPNDGDSPCGTR